MQVHFDELTGLAGRELGVSDWLEIDQARIDTFAEASGDHQWIHVDVERATASIGGTIAHGLLTLSLIPHLSSTVLQVDGASHGVNYGFNKVRFTNIGPVGSKIRARLKMLSVDDKSGGKRLTREVTVEIEDQEQPALIAEWIVIVYK